MSDLLPAMSFLALVSLVPACGERPPEPSAEGSDQREVDPGRPPASAGQSKPAKMASLVFEKKSDGLPATGNYAGVALADLDGDGKMELLSGRRDEEEGLFLFRFDNGKWTSQQLTDSGDYGGVALADITGDKIPDVLAVKTAGSPKGLELFATVKAAGGKLQFAPLASPYTQGCDDLDIADFDGDGDLDIAVSSRGVRVFLNSGDASSFETIELDSDVYEDTGIVVTDVNADGVYDILSANHPGKNVRLFLGESRSPVQFSDRHTAGLPLDERIGFKIAAADFDADGHMDVAVGTQPRLRIFMGNGCQGDETTWWKEARLPDSGGATIQPVAADLDRDGDFDLVFTSNRGIYLCLNDGAANFTDRLTLEGLPTEGEYSGCAVVDWDGDGDPDLAISSFQGEGIHFFENTGR